MRGESVGLVDVVREFLTADRLMGQLLERYRQGELRFSELKELIGDDEDSVLFRLKERCHALFRSDEGGVARHREVLFDLTVGSLFHEAMKLREDFYQREVYGPRMRSLKSEAGDEAAALFEEFERILAAVSERIEEVMGELAALVQRAREQLPLLLAGHRDNGHVIRCLIEHRALVEAVFPDGLDALLREVYGDPAGAYRFAGRSYLESGYFGEAERAFAEAIARGGSRPELERLCSYARGMRAYVAGDYVDSVRWLADWMSSETPPDGALLDFAHSAVSRIKRLAQGKDRESALAGVDALLPRIVEARSVPDQDGAASAVR